MGYQGLTVNVGNGDKAQTPFGQDKRVRQALSLAIDREVINQVVFEGAFAAGNQPYPPTSPWYNASLPVPARDVEAAKALLAEAGVENPTVEIQVSTNPVAQQVVQVVQAMASEAGINVERRGQGIRDTAERADRRRLMRSARSAGRAASIPMATSTSS